MNTRVVIIHGSPIVSEGLHHILHNSSLQLHDHLRVFNQPDDITIHRSSHYIFITTAGFFQNLYKYQLISVSESRYRFLLLNTDDSPAMHNLSSDTIYLNDTQNQIVEKLRHALNSFIHEKNTIIASLTERETEILKLVALGNASKEIADKLSISTHTVITHRKNITEKLGIKSISGLTVYAILNKIIDTDQLSINDLI